MAKRPINVRRRAVDGKFLRWELMSMSELDILPEPAKGKDGKMHPSFDHQVWVVTGIFNSRKEAFA